VTLISSKPCNLRRTVSPQSAGEGSLESVAFGTGIARREPLPSEEGTTGTFTF